MQIEFEAQVSSSEFANLVALDDKLHHSFFIKHLEKEHKTSFLPLLKQLNFSGKKGEGQIITVGNEIFAFFGVGKKEDLNPESLVSIGGKCYSWLKANRIAKVAIHIASLDVKNVNDTEIACQLGLGFKLKDYQFNKYKSSFTKKDDDISKKVLTEVSFILDNAKDTTKEWKLKQTLAESVHLARDLISEPPNILYPETMALHCKELRKLGVEVEVLDEEKMQILGMNALLGVAQGSAKTPRMIIMYYKGGNKGDRPIAFVGKGVTFDTGGISLKPAAGMEDMKYDMAGSAAVVGTIHQLASRKAKVNAVGVIGMVENMPDGNAQRPSDVVVSMSGQTIEVLNTDAEGRLVLADVLWYTQDRFKPKAMVDLATLTGAISVTFSNIYAGLFSNNDELSNNLLKSGEKTGEKLWRLPLGEEYDRMIDSSVADMQNISNSKGGGSITAAQFLARFVNKTPWAHLDIAGVAWASKEQDLTFKGAVGFGVRLLNQLVSDFYEN
ncbi:leucyl aminopeptidase [Rickettsiales endosymbiont of Stachyamoeba lipophora]|uniref:leucyl aminopeptidase n=1 Tax=Rickettsiales endosymbiont of Stachyamoeba lipophora TaxID=2486578 RepID=UPI000F64988C|nr:leucyl aminopeptidase [Rickettsiales endosymbiont of Stachyamoeba lipophora]AZL15705.1 leucyl aminopeptidase [Rickettsiales endosymbiont of Stachyamoeba lipophora]